MTTDTLLLNITPTVDELIKQERLTCSIGECSSTFQNNSTLQFHLRKHHRINLEQTINQNVKVQYFCPQSHCKYNAKENGGAKGAMSFASKKYLKQHFLKMHAAKEFTCDKCDKKFACRTLCHQHEKSCGDIFKCDVCSWTYKSRECLLTHCRRKGHAFPKTAKCSGAGTTLAPKATNPFKDEKTDSTPNFINSIPNDTKKWISIAPDYRKQSADSIIESEELLKNLKKHMENASKRTVSHAKKQSKISQMTQTASLYKVNCNKMSKMVTNAIAVPTPITKSAVNDNNKSMSSSAITMNEAKANEKYKNLDLIDEESNTLISNASHTYRNLNHLNYVEDESTLNYLENAAFNSTGLCHIETQTELSPFTTATDNIDCSRDMDPLLYSHMHTQTCDEILTELGLTTIHTQTNWPEDDYNDLFVSTETQTCFPHLIMDNTISTQTTQTPMDHGKRVKRSNRLSTNEFSFSNQCTQTQQTDYW